MTTIAPVAQAMDDVLTTVAEEAARRSGFIQRQRQLSGASFGQALVFGWLATPDATAEERAQAAAARGVRISADGLDKRCTEAAADCLHQVLAAAVQRVITAAPVAVPLLRRFAGVYLYDSSTLALPEALREEWPGGGGDAPSGAARKIGVRRELVSGALHGPVLGAGRDHDLSLPLGASALPPGALRLADLGFFALDLLRTSGERGGYWLSRRLPRTAVCALDGTRLDRPILLGADARVSARLLAMRVPQEVADARRQRLRDQACQRGRGVSATPLALAGWTVLVTNVPAELLTLDEALVLRRTRWQVERLFDRWKQHGHPDKTRSTKPWRILCAVYAKLLALLIQHWVLLTGSWAHPDRSFVQAARTVRQRAAALSDALDEPAQLARALDAAARCLTASCRVAKRRLAPGTAQQLLAGTGDATLYLA